MVLPKSTVHVSRLAGTALKSFTHGYAQTVVAASQSSYASQNTPVTPLASNFLSRFKDQSNKAFGHHAQFSTNAALVQQAHDHGARQDGLAESNLVHFHEIWQKHNRSDKEQQSISLARRVGWTPAHQKEWQDSLVVPEASTDAEKLDLSPGTRLKRSYSTSAIDNFVKAIDNGDAEALAINKVHESISQEAGITKPSSEITHTALDEHAGSKLASSPISQAETQLYQLHEAGSHELIPAAFQAVLSEGVAQPTQRAYQALLASALSFTRQQQQQIPRLLDIYADMVRREVSPDAKTLAVMVEALAQHAAKVADTARVLTAKLSRLGNANVFALDALELKISTQDQTLDIALGFISTAPADFTANATTTEALIKACASRGRIAEMITLYNESSTRSQLCTSVYPAMITAFGQTGDMANAVAAYDSYRDLAIANNAGSLPISRVDRDVYVALVSAYSQAGRSDKAKQLMARIDAEEKASGMAMKSREHILVNAILPYEIASGNFKAVYDVINSLSSASYGDAVAAVAISAADNGDIVEAIKAFDACERVSSNVQAPAAAILAAHLRTKQHGSAERFFQAIKDSPVTLQTVQLATLRALSLFEDGSYMSAVGPVGDLLVKYKDSSAPDSQDRQLALERIEECILVLSNAATNLPTPTMAEVLRIMNRTGVVLAQTAERALIDLTPDAIAQLAAADLEIFIQYQARLVLDGSYYDPMAESRFSFLLQTLVRHSVLPDVATEDVIEKALLNLRSGDLDRLWNEYRYPLAGSLSSQPTRQTISDQALYSPESTASPSSAFDESFDPYLTSTDHRGSVVITDLLEKSTGRSDVVLREAMVKFRNIRRAGRHPRFFAYSKLIQAAAKAFQLGNAEEILMMARQDVPYQPQFRIVRHGWIAILDSMVAACISTGRRDLAARHHQDLLDIGAAPSANTFGLYITSLKETTKTFDEASEAVKIFLRAKAEGVEPTSFLYNALIGKLGKARRIDDCLFYFAEMRNSGIRPTSVTYGTIVNALCRVSDEKFAEEIFEEMESSLNYKPRPAPYHSLMQFFLTTKRDRSKVLAYYDRMRAQAIQPTMHTFKLLIDAHATIEPVNMDAAGAVLEDMRASGVQPEAVHFASLIHAKGCVTHDLDGARALFDEVIAGPRQQVQPCVYQAMIEALVANKAVHEAERLLADMQRRRVDLTPYIVNALIHGWTQEKSLDKAVRAFNSIDQHRREPSTYEAMVRAHLACGDRDGAGKTVDEALSRGYPSAVAGKIAELVGGGRS